MDTEDLLGSRKSTDSRRTQPTAVRNTADRENVTAPKRIRAAFNGNQDRLNVAFRIDGHVLRWFNDTSGRIALALKAGWTIVTPSEVRLEDNHEGLVSSSSPFGECVTQTVGANIEKQGAMRAYLMKIPQQYYDEDRQSQHEDAERPMKAIRQGLGVGQQDVGNNYIPNRKAASLQLQN